MREADDVAARIEARFPFPADDARALARGLKTLRTGVATVFVSYLIAFPGSCALGIIAFALSLFSFVTGAAFCFVGLVRLRRIEVRAMWRRYLRFGQACCLLAPAGALALLDPVAERGVLWALGTAMAVFPGALIGTALALGELARRLGSAELERRSRGARRIVVAFYAASMAAFLLAAWATWTSREAMGWLVLLVAVYIILLPFALAPLARLAGDLRWLVEMRTPPRMRRSRTGSLAPGGPPPGPGADPSPVPESALAEPPPPSPPEPGAA